MNILKQLYGDNLLIFNGVTYPVIVYPANAATLDTILGDTPQSPRDDFAIYAADHLHKRQQTQLITNGETYVLDELQITPLRITARLGQYFDMVATCDALDHEMRDFLHGKRHSTPLRDAFHACIPPQQALLNGAGRSATIGCAVLTVFHHNGQYQIMLAQRAANLAVGAGLHHVLPAFVMQPPVWSVQHQVFREYGEELFAMPEFDADYLDFPPIIELRTMLDDGRADLNLTGVAFNLLTLRAEICMRLVIHDPAWFTRNQHMLAAASQTERQNTLYIPLNDLPQIPTDLTPQGAAAIWLGYKTMT